MFFQNSLGNEALGKEGHLSDCLPHSSFKGLVTSQKNLRIGLADRNCWRYSLIYPDDPDTYF
jgi:hypothetical protein